MNELISSLEPLVPVLIVLSIAFFMTIEMIWPFMAHSKYRKKQKWHNIGNIMVSFVLNAALSGFISASIHYANTSQFGLLPLLQLPLWASLVLGVFLVDLNSYVAHRLYHQVPLFWRFHRVHHSDTEMDASSALRLHPFEFIFQATTQATILPLLGVSFESFVLYALLAFPLFVMNHANLKFPAWYEKVVSLLFVTPRWHGIHHSSHQPETDSNYGDMFTLWDRFFGTKTMTSRAGMQYGLEYMRNPEDQTFIAQMTAPFKPIEPKHQTEEAYPSDANTTLQA